MTKPRIDLPVLSTRSNARRSPSSALRVGMVTLGCDKNTVDSERLLARLAHSGARVQSGAEGADVIVVNTCGFIDAAKEESIDTLLEAVKLKQQGRVQAVVAMGCLVQRYKQQLEAELPEVDAFIGLTEVDRLLPMLKSKGLLAQAVSLMERPLRLLTSDTPHTSYLKISEGCDHSCAFCAIPLMRGKHRSTPIEQLVREARELAERGVVELNIISQDTTWYGRDIVRGAISDSSEFFVGRPFNGMAGLTTIGVERRLGASRLREVGSKAGSRSALNHNRNPNLDRSSRHGLLVELLQQLLEQTSIPWLRLFYMYPSGIHRELVELLAREPRIVPYLDMPLQHGSDRMLVRMRRPERQHTIRERVRWLRDAVPELSLRTTLIVGFPGETEDDFEQLLELLEELRFDYVGAFAYSREEGTPAADMPEQVADDIKRERLERLLDLQRAISLENNERRLGSRQQVLIDSVSQTGAVGRTRGQALEVDGVVHVSNASTVLPGQFVNVMITDAMEHDLGGVLVQQ